MDKTTDNLTLQSEKLEPCPQIVYPLRVEPEPGYDGVACVLDTNSVLVAAMMHPEHAQQVVDAMNSRAPVVAPEGDDEPDNLRLAPLGHALSSITSPMAQTPEVIAVWDEFWKLNAQLNKRGPSVTAPVGTGEHEAKAKEIVEEYKQRVMQLPSGDAVPCAKWLETRLRIAFDLVSPASSPTPLVDAVIEIIAAEGGPVPTKWRKDAEPSPSVREAAEEIAREFNLEKPGWVTLGRITIDRETETEKFERTDETSTDRVTAILSRWFGKGETESVDDN